MSTNKSGRDRLRLGIASVAFLVLAITACQVTIPPGTVGNSEPITLSVGLGSTGIFNITIGAPVSNSARITNLNPPSSPPEVATLRLSASDIAVTPLDSAQDIGTREAISGTFVMRFRIADSDASDPCESGVDAGTFTATVADNDVGLDTAFHILPDAALASLMTGAFTLCIEVEGNFSGTVVVSEIAFGFNDPEALPDGDGGGQGEDEPADPDGNDNPPSDGDNDNEGNDGDPPVSDPPLDDPPSDDPPSDDPPPDDPPSDDPPPDDGPEFGLTYTNLTDDADQDPDSGFDTFNEYGTVSGDGTVIAYLSNVDLTGESDDVANAEVMVLRGGTKVQVTHTTSITNTAGNTYDVTNYSPFVSGDGSVVVFGSDGDLLGSGVIGAEQIYAYDVEAASLTQLSALDTPAGGIATDTAGGPRVSADGQVIVWVENDTECPTFGCPSESRLRAADPQGNNLMSVVFTSELSFSDYALSADGTTIAFVSSGDPAGSNPNGLNQLFLMGVPSAAVTQVSALTTGASAWTPSYAAPGLSPNGSLIAVWTNDPAATDSEGFVLALVGATGGVQSILARQGVDFPAGDDALGRPRITPDGRFVAFSTRWSFAYTQRNFRADVVGGTLKEVGIGTRTVSPTITDDGSTLIIAGSGYEFYPEQLTGGNPDGNSEIWSARITD